MTRIVAGPAAHSAVAGVGLSCALACLGWAGLFLSAASAQEAKPAPGEAAKAGCDANCARQAIPAAIQACVPGIERQAPTDFEWMNRPTGTIFQEAEPPSGAETVVKYRGDSVRFLNPQGQWVRITYECEYDTAGKSVRGVKVRLGRIDGKGANTAAAALPAGSSASAARPPAATTSPPQVQVKRPRPSEPSEVEIRQVAPSAGR
ncbi:conserved hypothetical protein [Methylorubrum populi BJ001]|jgi:hypothetical protein|uniref:Uncharacterized protein n=1 Tax=Methylorubrum populi (strain ATCC BAA-705 / NCIMB 13946 / BJ001) TaxID=441620 RepID=B1ZEY5_METPB|nr:hypothetical protein [Methylorubrum populi]ACB78232.1 conserved hypothetical protein [Methylorubrum populi BJ001]OAH39375.1 hypothetical protein AX289_15290 [Methylorubrum populi]PZP71841.1 MAG: hypothetical protein DI590_06145 [Methylorubrum populi]